MKYTGLFFLGFIALTWAVDWDEITPLDDYVHREDPSYNWEVTAMYEGDGFTMYVINMTSQTWMDDSVSNTAVWVHALSIFIPDEIRINNAAILRVTGGSKSTSPPTIGDSWSQRWGRLAVRSGAVMAQLNHDPNQPVLFNGSLVGRVEDSIIAYTWKLYIEDENEEPDTDIILQLPMVKAAKQALDTITEFTSSVNPELDIQMFMPTGASKRGWVAWLLACTDQRVFATAPVVFDLLEFHDNLQRHLMSLGAWSWAFIPYWAEGVAKYLIHPRTEEMAWVIDPLAYNERLDIPKLMTIASGDEFFRPDASHLFWDQLNGDQNYMLILEGADHSHGQFTDRVHDNIEAFFTSLLTNYELPSFTWVREQDEDEGSILVTCSYPPTSIRGWWADTTNRTGIRRDFRLVTALGASNIEWDNDDVEDLGDGQYRVIMPLREDGVGFRAFFIEATFEGPDGRELNFSTELEVLPDIFPFPPCTTPEECNSSIV